MIWLILILLVIVYIYWPKNDHQNTMVSVIGTGQVVAIISIPWDGPTDAKCKALLDAGEKFDPDEYEFIHLTPELLSGNHLTITPRK